MAKKISRNTFMMENPPTIFSFSSTVGKKEGEGPLGDLFDVVLEDDMNLIYDNGFVYIKNKKVKYKINYLKLTGFGFFFLNMSRLLMRKLRMPEKPIARRLQITTSQLVNFSISSIMPSLIRNTAEHERSYARKSLRNCFLLLSGLTSVRSFHT